MAAIVSPASRATIGVLRHLRSTNFLHHLVHDLPAKLKTLPESDMGRKIIFRRLMPPAGMRQQPM
jgi:hypothetical protein